MPASAPRISTRRANLWQSSIYLQKQLTLLYDSVIILSVDETWTLPELVGEVTTRLARLPAPKNGQVRAVPDERGLRYYGTIGLLDRPVAMRGRTALYGRRHLAQVVAIKRLQSAGRTLAEILSLWPTLDDAALQRMSGVEIPDASATRARARYAFWKHEAAASSSSTTPTDIPVADTAPRVRRSTGCRSSAASMAPTPALWLGSGSAPRSVAALTIRLRPRGSSSTAPFEAAAGSGGGSGNGNGNGDGSGNESERWWPRR